MNTSIEHRNMYSDEVSSTVPSTKADASGNMKAAAEMSDSAPATAIQIIFNSDRPPIVCFI